MILGLKLGRRLIAAAALHDEEFRFQDSRFVPSTRTAMLASMTAYFGRVLDQTHPSVVFYYAPTGAGTVTSALVATLERVAAEHGVLAKSVTKGDVFGSFGIVLLKTRRELRAHLQHLWPALADGNTHRQTALAEAAATAMVGELQQVLPPL